MLFRSSVVPVSSDAEPEPEPDPVSVLLAELVSVLDWVSVLEVVVAVLVVELLPEPLPEPAAAVPPSLLGATAPVQAANPA